MPQSLDRLKSRLKDVNAIDAAIAMMEWDQQTYMPRGGAAARAEHVGALSRMSHQLFVSDEMQDALQMAKTEVASEDDLALIRVVQRDMDLRTQIPAELVAEKSRLGSEGHEVWVEARSGNDFPRFAPYLEKMVDICRQEAECIGYRDHIYDALTDYYEEGASKASWDAMFDSIRQPLVDLVREIKESGNQADNSFLFGKWDQSAQQAFTEKIVREVGFDFDRGRQDTAPHPFCTGWSVGDVRLTTRYMDDLTSAIFSSLHEAGHGMYEQGSPMEWDGLPLAGGVSLGIHESQSRTWENIVGRSRAFWSHYFVDLKAAFPSLNVDDVEAFYCAVNRVEPSLIRVEADEVTYNLHIMVRFELECELLSGSLAVKDLPEAWNAKYQSYLGITPPTDREGCLQDVHWSGGSIGYFPTYSMGNILSYQIWNTLKRDLGDVDAMMAAGDFRTIFEWLRDKVYRQGSKYRPTDLVQRVTGRPMEAADYLEGITVKYRSVYGLA